MSGLPKEWTSDRLKDVSEINASSLPANTDADYEFDYLEISNVNYHGIVDPKSIERLRYEDAPSRARRRLGVNCTAISSVRPNLQAVAFIENTVDDLVCSTGFNVVRPVAHKLAPKFTYYSLLSDGARQYFEATAKGVGYPAVDDKDFLSFEVPLPPLPEQQRIATYLDASCAAIDAAVSAKRSQLETLDSLRKSIIQMAVTQGLNADVEMKESGVEWLGAIPKHWKIEPLKRCGRLKGGAGFPPDEQGITDAEVPFYKVKHLQSARYLTECDNTVSYETARRLGADIIPPNTIVFAKVGAALLLNRFRILTRPSCIDNNMMALLLERRCYRMAYFFHVMNLLDLAEFANQGPVPSVNAGQVGQIKVPIPPEDEQDHIVQFVEQKVDQFDELVFNIEAQLSTLTAYRKSLIHESVTGQRRITEADLLAIRKQNAGMPP